MRIHDMTQAAFAKITRLGEATISRWDTSSNNRYDSVKHGTNPWVKADRKGKKGPNKLTSTQVLWIRFLHKNKLFTLQELGNLFGVHRNTIWYVKNHETWTHI